MLARMLPLCLVLLVACAAHADDVTVRVGMVRSISNAATLNAVEKGYFKAYGIKVETEDIDTSANVIALLAQNQFQIIEGGISAGYFNAIEKDFPIAIVMDRVSSPIGHNLMLRPDLKDEITQVRQLKGKIIASNGPGSVSTYETGKILETAGLTLADVEIKVLPFTQMALALANKAVDAALVIPPFVSQFLAQGHAVAFADPDDLVEPRPMTIAVNIINTAWAAKNPNLVRNYYVAYLRGVREYCQAYHGGAARKDIIDLVIRSGAERRPELLYKYPWPARSADGRINVASMLDMQAWYVKNGFTRAQFPPSRLVDTSYVEHAVAKLGPFVLENKESTLQGCR